MSRSVMLAATLLAAAAAGDESAPITHWSELVEAARARIVEIRPAELAPRVAGEHAVVVDVREPYEYRRGYLPGAVNIPRGRLEFDILDHPALATLAEDDAGALADAEIVVYCRTGGRGALAAQTLESMGFRNVRSLQGGFNAWSEAGLPVEDGETDP